MIDAKRPCGHCDISNYCEAALTNKIAVEFGKLSESERIKNIPKCSKRDIDCVGATHYHEMLINIDNQALRNESLGESK
jgi:hypothetical protein